MKRQFIGELDVASESLVKAVKRFTNIFNIFETKFKTREDLLESEEAEMLVVDDMLVKACEDFLVAHKQVFEE